ncbi:Alpha/Beta hydrolase protein [Dactylonectria macrodidyma]|uniref:Alpha/Beta hydrolase protein n=1 Tax=Dactylonectria macrodidyma TaxID=307937 RepID=A0A9P9JA83_9HYPO|nr:Alpha/Beta hydrolase protein [Dactylonectria macrodidyma]
MTAEIIKSFPSAEETLSHPSYPGAIWGLEPHKEGKTAAGKGRGGPINIAWEIHGSGPIKMAFIMGLAGVMTSWQRQTKYFGHDHADEYSMLIIDNRGMGGSDKPLGRYSTSEMAKDIIEVLDDVGWTAHREVNLVGISMGGMIAQELAVQVPHRLQSLSLLCSSAGLSYHKTMAQTIMQGVSSLVPKSQEQTITDTALKLFTPEWLAAPDGEDVPVPGKTARCRPPPPEAGPVYGAFGSNFQRYQAQELAKRRDLAAFSTAGMVSQMLAVGWHDKTDDQLRAMADAVGRERILVMHGTRDNLISLPNGQRLVDVIQPGVGLIVEGMGHSPPMERFKWLNELLEERLRAWSKL